MPVGMLIWREHEWELAAMAIEIAGFAKALARCQAFQSVDAVELENAPLSWPGAIGDVGHRALR